MERAYICWGVAEFVMKCVVYNKKVVHVSVVFCVLC